MVAENFSRALRLVLVDEGGLDDDPHDHGGRTAHGIIQREYDGFRARKNLPRQDVWKITPAEYTEIYHDQYWRPWCDRLPAGLDYAWFDACVNAGPSQAAKTLQKALGVRVDGHMGEVTLAKVRAAPDIAALIARFCDTRRAFYRALAQFPRYGRGWLARVDHVERAAKAMAATADLPAEARRAEAGAGRNGLSDELKVQASARSRAEDVAAPPVSAETAAAATTASGVGSGLTEQLAQTSSQLAPFQDTIRVVQYALIAVATVSLALTLYALWRRAKTREATG